MDLSPSPQHGPWEVDRASRRPETRELEGQYPNMAALQPISYIGSNS